MVSTRCYRNGRLTGEGFPLAEVSDYLAGPESMVWVDLCAPEPADLKLLAEQLDLHDLAVEDAVHARQRPKVDRYPEHAFLSAYAVHLTAGSAEVATAEVAAFITPRALVTVRQSDDFDIGAVTSRWESNRDLARYGVAYLVHGLLDYIVDGHFETVQDIDEEVDDLEEMLFGAGSDPVELQRRSFELRKTLVVLRRLVLPMREVVNTLMRRDLQLVGDEMGPYYQDLYDHVLRVSEWTDSLRDLITSVLETNLTVQGNRLNVITKKVTGWAAIVAVPTAITGFYGQNVPYPGFSTEAGFIVSTSIIVIGSLLLYLVFRKKDWL